MSPRPKKIPRPDPFRYHDYREFLKSWLAYAKASQLGVSSIRELAKAAKISSGYLPPVFSKKSDLSLKAWNKIHPLLGILPAEELHLRNLIEINKAPTHAERISKLEKIASSRRHRTRNPAENRTIKYFNHWLNIVIREMTFFPSFQWDADWIRASLLPKSNLTEIKAAMQFLQTEKFVEVVKKGDTLTAIALDQPIEADHPTFGLALARYHQQFYSLATESIHYAKRPERFLMGHTIKLSRAQYAIARKILEDAMNQIRALFSENENQNLKIFHISESIFPVANSLTNARKDLNSHD